MNRFAVILLFVSSVTFGQEKTARLRPGIQISSVFSDNYDYGLSPALTLNYKKCMLTLGPRFTYERIFRENSIFYQQNDQLMLDAAFRYYLLPETKVVRLFAQAGTSYKYKHLAFEQEYRDELMLSYGPAFDHDFLGVWDKVQHRISVCAGFGVDIRIWKQFSGFVSAGAGTSVEWGKSSVTNVGTGVEESFSRTRNYGKFSWIASAGFAYSF